MIPKLYDAGEKEFRTNGLGALTDAISCAIENEVNGGFELEMQYPSNGLHAGLIRKNRIILAKTDMEEEEQPFRIYRINKDIGGSLRIFARHIAYDLRGIPVSPFTAGSAAKAMGKIQENAATICPFTLTAEVDSPGELAVETPKDGWTLIGKSGVLSVYPGELEFDRFSIRLRERLGKNRGAAIRYGVNLQSFQQDENCGDVYTGIYPYWEKDGQIVTLAEKTMAAPGTYDHQKILVVDFSRKFDDAPSQQQLKAAAEKYITDNKVGVPEVSITLAYAKLRSTIEFPEAAEADIRIGDTVKVIFQKIGVAAEARVIKTRYNSLEEIHESVSIGSVKQTISDTIKKQAQQAQKLSSGLSAAGKRIEKVEKDFRFDMESLTAEVEGAKAGLYLVASRDELDNLKEARSTLYAYVEDAKSSLNLLASRDELDQIKKAETTLYAQVEEDTENIRSELTLQSSSIDGLQNATASLLTRVNGAETALEMQSKSIDDLQTASVSLSARADNAEAELLLHADSINGISKSVADIKATYIDLSGNVSVSDGQLTVLGNLVAAKSLQIGTDSFYISGNKYTPTQITSTTGAVLALGIA